jgi:hypothetical protein
MSGLHALRPLTKTDLVSSSTASTQYWDGTVEKAVSDHHLEERESGEELSEIIFLESLWKKAEVQDDPTDDEDVAIETDGVDGIAIDGQMDTDDDHTEGICPYQPPSPLRRHCSNV